MKQLLLDNLLNGITGGVQTGLGRGFDERGNVMWDKGEYIFRCYPDKYNAQPIVNLN